MTTPHTSGAADLPEATASLIERLEDAVYEWGNYVDADHAPCPLTRHVDPHIKAIRAELERLHALAADAYQIAKNFMESRGQARSPELAAGQAVALAVDDKTAGHAMLWRQHCDKLDALVTYCPTCCQGFIAQKEMTRDQIIYECGKTAGRATRPAPPAMDDPGPFLDDEGRAMVGTSHHYTADNIRALVAEYKALESGAPEAVERYSNSDHRTRAGVLWRVISALADEVPFAPAMDGGDAGSADLPDRVGVYAWASGTSFALVLVDKRPSKVAAGGQFNAQVIESTKFYDGCPVTSWGRDGKWTLLHDCDAARAAQKEGEKP